MSWELARFNALANNMIKNNSNGQFNKHLTFEWEQGSIVKRKQPTPDEMKKIAAYWNEVFKRHSSIKN